MCNENRHNLSFLCTQLATDDSQHAEDVVLLDSDIVDENDKENDEEDEVTETKDVAKKKLKKSKSVISSSQKETSVNEDVKRKKHKRIKIQHL